MFQHCKPKFIVDVHFGKKTAYCFTLLQLWEQNKDTVRDKIQSLSYKAAQ